VALADTLLIAPLEHEESSSCWLVKGKLGVRTLSQRALNLTAKAKRNHVYVFFLSPYLTFLRIMSKQSRQSRWGAPLPSSSSVPSSSASISPSVAAGSLPEEATHNQQKMCDFSKNNSATAQRSSSSQQHEGRSDLQNQSHRRGYDMSHNDYYGGTIISIVYFPHLIT
jgi:hypothetical protein